MKLGGVLYEPFSVSSYSAAYDLYVQHLFGELGLTELFAQIGLTDNKDEKEALGRAVVGRIAESGRVAELVACFLQPVAPAKWSPAWAKETGKALEELPDVDDRRMVLAVFVKGLADFFHSGQGS